MQDQSSKSFCEFLRLEAKRKFDQVRSTWVDIGQWVLPHRTKWMLSQVQGERKNYHIVDHTHTLALRSYVAGFLEGNTSASRPWFRMGTGNSELDSMPKNHEWLDTFTRRVLKALSTSNFYHAAGEFYYDYGTFNTGAHFIDEIDDQLFFHTLTPGSYYVVNDSFGEAVVLTREFSLNVKALVNKYGKKVNGHWDWSNFSNNVRKMYSDGNYSQMVDVAQVIIQNDKFDPEQPVALLNQQWHSKTYELGTNMEHVLANGSMNANFSDPNDKEKFLKISGSSRKPFIIGKSSTSGNFEYGEKGPSLDALGLIKSLNKKAIAKDEALEIMLRPPMQGPANLRKSYISTASNTYVPLDPSSASQGGLKSIFEINPAIGALIQDVGDLRGQVDKLYYADFLLFLSKNPKTRTATETDAIVNEQQLVIGPNLQSLNWTYNVPVVEFVMDFVLDNDPFLPPPPQEMVGRFLKPEFISVFAQAQKAADLPQIDRYMNMVANVGQVDPRIFDKVNVDKLADIYEDRLYLPAGLNEDQDKVDAKRQQAQAQAERQQKLEAMTQVSGAAKNLGIKANNPQGEQQ